VLERPRQAPQEDSSGSGWDLECTVAEVRALPKGIRSLFLEKNNKQHDHHHQGVGLRLNCELI